MRANDFRKAVEKGDKEFLAEKPLGRIGQFSFFEIVSSGGICGKKCKRCCDDGDFTPTELSKNRREKLLTAVRGGDDAKSEDREIEHIQD